LSEEPEVPEDMDTEESPILDDLRYHLFSPTNIWKLFKRLTGKVE
jgi:hypothetical protein